MTILTQSFMPIQDLMSSTLSFTCFSRLPLEIREKIWLDSLPLRVVRVYSEPVAELSNNREVIRAISRVFLQAKPVAILQSCREARRVAFRSYTKLYPKGQSDVYTYIDFSRDTLFFEFSLPQISLGAAMYLFDTDKIQSLAIDNRYRNPSFIRSEFTQLKELIFVARPPVPSLEPLRESSIVLKEIEADYERKAIGFSDTFESVFRMVSQGFFTGFDPVRKKTVWRQSVFGPCHLTSLMVYERVECDHVKLWDFGFVQSLHIKGRKWSHRAVMEDNGL